MQPTATPPTNEPSPSNGSVATEIGYSLPTTTSPVPGLPPKSADSPSASPSLPASDSLPAYTTPEVVPSSVGPDLQLVANATATKRQYNSLSGMEKATLFRWLLARAEEAKTTPDSKLAEAASADLNLRVTSPNILYARKSLGIEKPKPEKPVVVSIEDRLAELDRRIEALNNALIKHLAEK